MNGMALCAGVGGLDLGLRLALGESYRTVCYVEREAYAAACLVARMEDKALDCAPVWDDVTTFAGEPWRGVVDIVTAGFPCQPWSEAGRRRGVEDERWIWPEIARVIREVGPGLVFLENVTGILAKGVGAVLGSLAEIGFDAEWDVYSACELGAPHTRERVFILGYARRYETGAVPWNEARESERREQEAARRLGEPRPAWAHQPGVPGVAYGVAFGVDRLRAAGNGVVPQQAARAFIALAERAGLMEASA